jgi:hypothetical protein
MLVLVAHSNAMIRRLNAETRARCDVLARFFAVATFQAVDDPPCVPSFATWCGASTSRSS